MLVLTRRIGEELIIDGNIRLRVLAVKGNTVKLGTIAPDNVRVLRKEVLDRRPAIEMDGDLAHIQWAEAQLQEQ
jgi:carbon storage regulator